MARLPWLLAAPLVWSVAASTVHADSVTFALAFYREQAVSGSSGIVAGSDRVLFGAGALSAANGQAISSGGDLSLSDAGITYSGSQVRSGNRGDTVRTYFYTAFVPTEDLNYKMAGEFAVQDLAVGNPGYSQLWVHLGDGSAGTAMESRQYGLNTSDLDYVLGPPDEGEFATNSGNLTGTLLKGHWYEFYWEAFSSAFPDADGGAKTRSSLNLSFSPVAVVPSLPPVPQAPASAPLPSTAALGGGLLTLIVARRRKRS